MPTATEAATRALALNPNLADGQLALAWARHWYDWNWSAAESAYRRAVELTPGDSWPRMNYAYFLGLRGRHDEAIAEARRSIAIDPVSVIVSRSLTDTLTLARRFDEAIEHGTRAIALEPAFGSSYWALGLAQAGSGRFADAVATLERGRQYSAGDAALEGFLGWAYARSGHAAEARDIARQLETRREAGYVTATHIALVYQGLGEMDAAMRWFRAAYDERATDCCAYRIAPQFDAAREDPRFRALIDAIESGGPGPAA
jgi:serine/threonine-protein kinase